MSVYRDIIVGVVDGYRISKKQLFLKLVTDEMVTVYYPDDFEDLIKSSEVKAGDIVEMNWDRTRLISTALLISTDINIIRDGSIVVIDQKLKYIEGEPNSVASCEGLEDFDEEAMIKINKIMGENND